MGFSDPIAAERHTYENITRNLAGNSHRKVLQSVALVQRQGSNDRHQLFVLVLDLYWLCGLLRPHSSSALTRDMPCLVTR